MLIISGGVVTPQPDSGSHWPPGITWPAVSFLIGCRLTTCRFSPLPPCANCVANLIPAAGHSPSRCNYAPLCLMLHWWPHTHLCPGCPGCAPGHMSLPHKCPLSTDPSLAAVPARSARIPLCGSPCQGSPLSPVAADNNNTLCSLLLLAWRAGVHHWPGRLTTVLSQGCPYHPSCFHINLEIHSQRKLKRMIL